MTKMGTILSTSMITLGIMLAMFALAAEPPLRQEPPAPTKVSTTSHATAAMLVQIASTRMRTRFVAINADTPRSESPQTTEAAAAGQALARRPNAKKTSAPKDKKLLQRPAAVPRPQSASLQWPWASWFK